MDEEGIEAVIIVALREGIGLRAAEAEVELRTWERRATRYW